MLTVFELLTVVGLSMFTACAVFILLKFYEKRSTPTYISQTNHCGEVSFDFEGDRCISASPCGLDLLGAQSPEEFDFHKVKAALTTRFDRLHTLFIADQTTDTKETLSSSVEGDLAELHVTQTGKFLSIHIAEVTPPSATDRHRAMTGKAHLNLLFEAFQKISHPVWSTDKEDRLIWSNRAFDALQNARSQDEPIFEHDPIKTMQENGQRVSVELNSPKNETRWYDVSAIEIDEDRKLFYAINVDGLIAAETAQRKFVQTLAKTFAQLSTGLAIFDRDMRLVLFNPALVDLSTLPAHFLSAQPNLQSFFDKLRENRIMPEPKDYASWRRQIADLVIKSSDGRYQETWSLPSGLTYRVTGRPHPDGAIALLIEDITAEVSLTRRFKGHIELSNSALETLKDAIIVFASDGTIAFWNTAFKEFCLLAPDTLMAEQNLSSVLKIFSKRFLSGPGLEALTSTLTSPGEHNLTGDVKLASDRIVHYELRSHGNSATIVTFRTTVERTQEVLPALASAP